MEKTWREMLDKIAERISRPSFETWIKNVKPKWEEDTLILIAPNTFSKDWLETKYIPLFNEVIYEVTGETKKLVITTDEWERGDARIYGEVEQILAQINGLPRAEKNQLFELLQKDIVQETTLNKAYTFENFNVNAGNRFAYAAAQSVADSLAGAYNPFFLYGRKGVGKTHLMQAIGNEVCRQNPAKQVIYLTAEQFSREFINSAERNKIRRFQKYICQADMLLLDDFEALIGNEQTQEEFFYIFNELHEMSKQIVITADRPPKEIPGMLDRLARRLEWGLVTEIVPEKEESKEEQSKFDLLSTHDSNKDADRMEQLEADVAELKRQLQELNDRLENH